MSYASGVQQLKNMQKVMDTWPRETREDFSMRVEAIKFAAREDAMQQMAVMYAGLEIAIKRTEKIQVERAGN